MEEQVLAGGELAVEQRLVAEQADAPAHLPGLLGQRGAEHADGTGVRSQERREHAQQRALAGPVWSEHHERLALTQRQRDIRERLALAEVPSEPFDEERGHAQALDTCSAYALCACAISSRTARSPPSAESSRNSSTGSGSPLTIPSKNSLRSW